MTSNINDNWEIIQTGVRDVERLMGQKEYNTSMVKARQTLEFMVKLLADRAGIPEGDDLKTKIDTLYQYHWIKKSTCEHYHKIRVIGNQAVHDGNASPYDANLAHHMLSQEVYTFANDYRNAGRGSRPARTGKTSASAVAKPSTPSRSDSSRGTSGSSHSGSSRSGASSGNASTRSRRRQPSAKQGLTLYDLLRLLVPVLCIILLFCIVRLLKPSNDKTTETTPAVTTVAEEVTVAPTQEETAAVVYKVSPSISTSLNVRPEPNTDNEPIGRLAPGAEVTFVRTHDDSWAVILYDGQEAYVSSQYITAE